MENIVRSSMNMIRTRQSHIHCRVRIVKRRPSRCGCPSRGAAVVVCERSTSRTSIQVRLIIDGMAYPRTISKTASMSHLQ